MPRRSIAHSDWGTADVLESNKFEFKKGEILFGKLRPYFAALRDTLLPKLISGELRISDAEELLEKTS